MLPTEDPMTDHSESVYDLLKMLLAGSFLVGFLLGEFVSGKPAKLRLIVMLPICVLFLAWYFFL